MGHIVMNNLNKIFYAFLTLLITTVLITPETKAISQLNTKSWCEHHCGLLKRTHRTAGFDDCKKCHLEQEHERQSH